MREVTVPGHVAETPTQRAVRLAQRLAASERARRQAESERDAAMAPASLAEVSEVVAELIHMPPVATESMAVATVALFQAARARRLRLAAVAEPDVVDVAVAGVAR